MVRQRGAGFPAVLFVASLVSQMACVRYVVGTAQGLGHNVPATYHGVGPGAAVTEALKKGQWAVAEARPDSSMLYVLASPEPGVSEAEAEVSATTTPPQVKYVRLRYSATRLATYRDLLQALMASHGQPQLSEERRTYALFDPEKSDRPLPSRVVVHRWYGATADLVLVAGLEDVENLASSMAYQVLLVPADHPQVKAP